ncbi:hypothetical protein [Nocardia brasiliensis]|uniref:hypothetical protein n=1 Tax=Nocardia brasiliensis TaxID=37326 RepID=UPI003D8B56CD
MHEAADLPQAPRHRGDQTVFDVAGQTLGFVDGAQFLAPGKQRKHSVRYFQPCSLVAQSVHLIGLDAQLFQIDLQGHRHPRFAIGDVTLSCPQLNSEQAERYSRRRATWPQC